MAAGSAQDTTIGVGPALRKAREHRGLTLEEASRGTRLRVDQLDALEAEDFDALFGDAHVRGAMRTYASFLGLDPDKVVGAYSRRVDDPEPPMPPAKMGAIERAMIAARIRDNQRFLLIAAACLVGILILLGFVSREYSAPDPASIPTTVAPAAPQDQAIEVVLVARRDATVTVTVDGVPETHDMTQDETLSFIGSENLDLLILDGGSVQVTQNGRDLGAPGEPGEPWSKSFTFEPREAITSPTT